MMPTSDPRNHWVLERLDDELAEADEEFTGKIHLEVNISQGVAGDLRCGREERQRKPGPTRLREVGGG